MPVNQNLTLVRFLKETEELLDDIHQEINHRQTLDEQSTVSWRITEKGLAFNRETKKLKTLASRISKLKDGFPIAASLASTIRSSSLIPEPSY